MPKKLTETDRVLMVEMLKANKKRSEIAAFFKVDSTVIDKARSGIETNPKYPYEKWSDLSRDEKNVLCAAIENGDKTLTSVVNGWQTTRVHIENYWGRLILPSEKDAKKTSQLEDIRILKKVVKNYKLAYKSKLADKIDCIVMEAVLEALNEI